MTVLQDIENNFSNLKNYKLINNNTNFGIFFEYIDNLFNLIVDKDLKYLFLNGDKSYIYVINLILAKKRDISGVLKIIKDNFKISKKSVNSSIDSFGLFRNINVFNKGGCNLSFAGLKTAVLKISKTLKNNQDKYDLAASFQKTIEEILNKKTKIAFNQFKKL